MLICMYIYISIIYIYIYIINIYIINNKPEQIKLEIDIERLWREKVSDRDITRMTVSDGPRT